MHLSPEGRFVKQVFEDLLLKRESRRKFVVFFDLGGGVPPPKPLGLEMGIHMCSYQLLEFLNCHIRDEEGGNMTFNLPQKENEGNIKYDHMYRKTRK